MRLASAARNPHGAADALYLLCGDAAAGPVARIELDAGVDLSPRHGTRRLRLFHFNDLHNALQAHDGNAEPAPLFSRIVARYRSARRAAAEDEVVLLLSGGDDHTGTPFDELLGWSPAEFVVDPAYAAYSAAGVDAAALGNHDLDRGSALLATGIARCATFPVLSANVGGSPALVAGRDYFPGAVLVAKGLRIALVGLTTPVDTRAGTASDPGLTVSSPLAALAHLLPALAAHTDLLIVMSHCGYGVDSREMPPAFGAGFLAEGDMALARRAAALTRRPVLILGAHSHTVLNVRGFGPASLVDGVPIVQAGGHGSHLGEFTATLALESTRAHWSFAARLHPLSASAREAGDAASGSVPAGDADADAEFERDVIAPMLARLRQRTDEVVATVDDDPELGVEATLRARYSGECALANFITDALVARSAEFPHGPADLAIVNSTAIASGLAGGALTFRDWYRVQPFADMLQLAELSAAQLLAILASNARRIVRPEELDGPQAIDPRGYVSRGFLHFSRSLRYALRLGSSALAAGVAGVEFAARPLDPGSPQKFRAVLTTYLGAGGYAESWNGNPIGAGVEGFLPGYDLRPIPKQDTGLVFRNEVLAQVRALGRIGAGTGARRDGRLRVE
jgi:2',3'-cyclic-nucleotide 2'-phosphodiesterase (5'-nucleotidase family)